MLLFVPLIVPSAFFCVCHAVRGASPDQAVGGVVGDVAATVAAAVVD